jgi:FkbM family methyltransferase
MCRFPSSTFLQKIYSFYDPNNIRRHSSISNYDLHIVSSGKDGERMSLDLNQHIDYKFFFWGYFDDLPKKLITQMGSSSEILFIDVGANIGLISIPIALEGYETIAIEPLPHHINRFHDNLKLNPSAKLLLLESAVGAKQNNSAVRFLKIFSPPGNSGASSSDPNWNPSVDPSETYDVPLSTIDELCTEFLAEKTFTDVLVKIDVEGMELEVLSGCKNILTNFRPVILIEWKPNTKILEKYHKLDEFLAENSYKLQELNLSQSTITIGEFDPNKVYENLLIVPEERTIFPSDSF